MAALFLKESDQRKRFAVTPAISTMVLLSGTLVLSLIVGAYVYGLDGPNVVKIQLTSIQLYDGVSSDNLSVSATSSLLISLKNPGLGTNISSITLIGSSISTSTTSWATTPNAQPSNSVFVQGQNNLSGGKSQFYTLYPVASPSVSILIGQTFDYTVSFSNGQTISGAILAQ
jgi:hypothetical protein